MFAIFVAAALALPPYPQPPAPKQQTPEPQPIRLRCTDGTLIERTATGWRVVGNDPANSRQSVGSYPAIPDNSGGCPGGVCRPVQSRRR